MTKRPPSYSPGVRARADGRDPARVRGKRPRLALRVSDFTSAATLSGFVYAAFVIDVFARRIVGWRVSRTAQAAFGLDALDQALHARCPLQGGSLVHHSDRGSHDLALRYTERLADAGVEPFVGSVGDSDDNALAETLMKPSTARHDPIAPARWDRGGCGTKACVIADGQGRAIAFRLAPGQAHEPPHAVPPLDQRPGIPEWAIGDRSYTSHAVRQHIRDMAVRPAIPPQRYEAPVACLDRISNNRDQVERLWTSVKEWRAIADRSEITALSFIGGLCLAATLNWLKRWHN